MGCGPGPSTWLADLRSISNPIKEDFALGLSLPTSTPAAVGRLNLKKGQ